MGALRAEWLSTQTVLGLPSFLVTLVALRLQPAAFSPPERAARAIAIPGEALRQKSPRNHQPPEADVQNLREHFPAGGPGKPHKEASRYRANCLVSSQNCLGREGPAGLGEGQGRIRTEGLAGPR